MRRWPPTTQSAPPQAPTRSCEAFGGKPTIVIIDEIAKHLRQVTSSGSEDVRRMAQADPGLPREPLRGRLRPGQQRRPSSSRWRRPPTRSARRPTRSANSCDVTATATATVPLAETADVLARAVQPSRCHQARGRRRNRRDPQEPPLRATSTRTPPRQPADAYRDLYEALGQDGDARRRRRASCDLRRRWSQSPTRSTPNSSACSTSGSATSRSSSAPAARSSCSPRSFADIYTRRRRLPPSSTSPTSTTDDAPVLNHLTDGLGRAEFAGRGQERLRRAHVARGRRRRRRLPGSQPLRHPRRPHRVHPLAGDEGHRRRCPQRLDARNAAARRRRRRSSRRRSPESEKVFWHLSFDGARWRFNVEPNVNAIIETEKRNIAEHRALPRSSTT